MSLDPVALATLTAVVREGTFERAAARLHVTPSAVSQRIKGLERAVGQVSAALQSDPLPQLMIVNKFGKHEADGRGMRPVIAEALARGIPVLSGVNRLNVAPFQAFADGLATAAEPDLDALEAWAVAAVHESAND